MQVLDYDKSTCQCHWMMVIAMTIAIDYYITD